MNQRYTRLMQAIEDIALERDDAVAELEAYKAKGLSANPDAKTQTESPNVIPTLITSHGDLSDSGDDPKVYTWKGGESYPAEKRFRMAAQKAGHLREVIGKTREMVETIGRDLKLLLMSIPECDGTADCRECETKRIADQVEALGRYLAKSTVGK